MSGRLKAVIAGIAGIVVLIGSITVLQRADQGDAPSPDRPSPSHASTIEDPPDTIVAPVPGDRTSIAFRSRARSVRLVVPEIETTRLRFTGGVRLRFDGPMTATDARGRRFEGVDLSVRGPDVRMSAAYIRVDDPDISIDGAGRVTLHEVHPFGIDVRDMRIRRGRVKATSVFSTGPHDGARLRTPVTVTGSVDFTFRGPVRWHDGPTQIDADGVHRISWTGGGQVALGREGFSGRALGATGSLTVSTTIDDGRIHVDGHGIATQVFMDGSCVKRARPTSSLTKPTVRASPSSEGSFEWTFGNRHRRWALCIEEIRAVSTAGTWVNARLSPLPPMFGAGDRISGGRDGTLSHRNEHDIFNRIAGSLDAFHLPETRDQREITFDVPADAAGDQQIVLEVRGNFEPFRVTVLVRIRP